MTTSVIRTVLFDLDNTLLDRDAAFAGFCRELYHTSGVMGRSHSEAEAVDVLQKFDSEGLRPRHEFFSDVIQLWPNVFADIDQAMQVYLTTYPRMAVLEPETRFLLEDIRERSIHIAIVTNGGSIMQMNKVRESGLEGLVDAVVISESIGIAKPDPRIFEHALAELNADVATTIFVGDNPDADIRGANNLGMRTAWVRRARDWPYTDIQPDHTIDHVSEVRSTVLL